MVFVFVALHSFLSLDFARCRHWTSLCERKNMQDLRWVGEKRMAPELASVHSFPVGTRIWAGPAPMISFSYILCHSPHQESAADISLRILRDLAEATNEFSFTLPARRRAELHQGLVVSMPQLFPFLLYSLQSNSSRVTPAESAANSASFATASELLSQALHSIAAYTDWLNVSYEPRPFLSLTSEEDAFFLSSFITPEVIQSICSTLSNPEFFLISLEIIEKLTSRSLDSQLFLYLWQQLIPVAYQVISAPPFENQASFLLRMSEVRFRLSKNQTAENRISGFLRHDKNTGWSLNSRGTQKSVLSFLFSSSSDW